MINEREYKYIIEIKTNETHTWSLSLAVISVCRGIDSKLQLFAEDDVELPD